MLIIVGVDVGASVLFSERKKDVPSQRIRVVSDGRELLRVPNHCRVFFLFLLQKQRVLRAHVESSERGWAGPRPVGGRADGERAGEVS